MNWKTRQIVKTLVEYTLVFFVLLIVFDRFNSIKSYKDKKIIALGKNMEIELDKMSSTPFSFYDISQAKYYVSLPTPFPVDYSKTMFYNPLKQPGNPLTISSISFVLSEVAEFYLVSIEPDEHTLTSIKYYDQIKIERFNKEGLSFYAKFPERQKKQMTRILILTALATIFLDTSFKLIMNFLEKIGFLRNMSILGITVRIIINKVLQKQ